MSAQKFKRGDIVHIVKDLGPGMSHFDSDKDAIVMGSYRDQFGGNCTSEYTVMFLDNGSECSWYGEHQLIFLHHGGAGEIKRVNFERNKRDSTHGDLDWIVANWLTVRECLPCASIDKLMELVGIENPWGPNGEGLTYHANAMATIRLLDPVLCEGSVEKLNDFIKTLK